MKIKFDRNLDHTIDGQISVISENIYKYRFVKVYLG